NTGTGYNITLIHDLRIALEIEVGSRFGPSAIGRRDHKHRRPRTRRLALSRPSTPRAFPDDHYGRSQISSHRTGTTAQSFRAQKYIPLTCHPASPPAKRRRPTGIRWRLPSYFSQFAVRTRHKQT